MNRGNVEGLGDAGEPPGENGADMFCQSGGKISPCSLLMRLRRAVPCIRTAIADRPQRPSANTRSESGSEPGRSQQCPDGVLQLARPDRLAQNGIEFQSGLRDRFEVLRV